MENAIHSKKIINFLKADGSIFRLITPEDNTYIKKLIFGNMTNWEKISTLPEYVYHAFDMKMRKDCFVSEASLYDPPASGPAVVFEEQKGSVSIRIDTGNSPSGMLHYRRCLAVVAYFVGIIGKKIQPALIDGTYHFSDEDWIIMSIAARYCLMPEKFIKKILILTQMSRESGGFNSDMPLFRSFVEHLAYQTAVPQWVVMCRLREHAFSNREVAALIPQNDLETLIGEYRKNENYIDPLVDSL